MDAAIMYGLHHKYPKNLLAYYHLVRLVHFIAISLAVNTNVFVCSNAFPVGFIILICELQH